METLIPFIVLFAAILIEVILENIPGIRYVFALPLSLVRSLAGWFDGRLNRENRGRNERRVRGAIVLLTIALPVWVGAAVFDGYASQGLYGAMIDTCILLFLIGGSRPIARLRRVNRVLRGAYNERASRISNSLVRWDTENLDGHGIARADVHRSCWLLGLSVLLVMAAIAGMIIFLKQSS